jgi:hypothetical protein
MGLSMALELGSRQDWLVMRKALATMKVMRAEINILLALIS